MNTNLRSHLGVIELNQREKRPFLPFQLIQFFDELIKYELQTLKKV